MRDIPLRLQESKKVERQFNDMKEYAYVKLYYDNFPGEVFNFVDKSIDYKIVVDLSEMDNAEPFYYKLYCEYIE